MIRPDSKRMNAKLFTPCQDPSAYPKWAQGSAELEEVCRYYYARTGGTHWPTKPLAESVVSAWRRLEAA
jgi:hypothetical protein